MSENDITVEIKDEDTKEQDFSPEELEADNTDWKAKALELKGIAKRRATQLAKAKEKLAAVPEPKVEPQDKKVEKKGKKSDELDYAQLAFHNSKSNSLKIETEEEMEFLKQQMEETGKSMQGLLNSKFFQTEYAAFKEAKIVDNSMPDVPNRNTATSASKTLEFWMNRGEELPPKTYENEKLILDIIDARYEKAKRGK